MPKATKKKNPVGAAQPSDAAPLEERSMDGFIAENAEKWNRAVHGSISSEGKLTGGVGEGASELAKFAEYDKLGGYITKGGRKVKTGSFYDFDNQVAREEPEVIFIFRDLDGDIVEVPEGEEIPIEVRAAEISQKNKATKAAAKASAAKGKKAKPSVEDEE